MKRDGGLIKKVRITNIAFSNLVERISVWLFSLSQSLYFLFYSRSLYWYGPSNSIFSI